MIFLYGSYVAIASIHSDTYLINDIKNYMYVCVLTEINMKVTWMLQYIGIPL